MQTKFGWRLITAAMSVAVLAVYGAFRFLADLLGFSQDFSAFRTALASVHSIAAKWPVATLLVGVAVGIGASYWWKSANVAAQIDRWWYRAKFFGIALKWDDFMGSSLAGDIIGFRGLVRVSLRNAGRRPISIHAAHISNDYGEVRHARRNVDAGMLELVNPTILAPNEEAILDVYLETTEGVDVKNLGLATGFNQWAEATFVIDTCRGRIEHKARPDAVINQVIAPIRPSLLFGLKGHREAHIWATANQQRRSALEAERVKGAPSAYRS